jgi:molecular chaperone DnaK (HSP70)
MDDVDFKTRVTREEFENLCTDLFDRVKSTIEDAIKFSEVTHVRPFRLKRISINVNY